VFTWEHYYRGIHLPAISAPMRFMAAMPARPKPSVVVQPSANGRAAPVLAVFDVEGTLVDTNVVEALVWLRLSEAEGAERARALAEVARKVPSFLANERRDRGEFLRHFYRQYRDADPDEVRALAERSLGELFLRRLSSGAVRRIRHHRAAGHRVVFITGALDFVIAPLEPLADAIVAARLHTEDGRFTGDLDRPPLVGEARASWIQAYARTHGADLEASYAYADSMSDLPMLETVGNPVAVNPDVSLTRVARKRRWPVEEWAPGRGTPKVMLPDTVVAR
jgi:HAD superfamily hydrolase (TIGR01490 family)